MSPQKYGTLKSFSPLRPTAITSQLKCENRLFGLEGKIFSLPALSHRPSSPHDSALSIAICLTPFMFIHAPHYTGVVIRSLFQHCIQKRKSRKAWSRPWGRGKQKKAKYLWLFIPSSFSIRLRITDVGRGIFPSSSSLPLVARFCFLFWHKHTNPFCLMLQLLVALSLPIPKLLCSN